MQKKGKDCPFSHDKKAANKQAAARSVEGRVQTPPASAVSSPNNSSSSSSSTSGDSKERRKQKRKEKKAAEAAKAAADKSTANASARVAYSPFRV